jgi:hypothetical protein
MFLTGIVGITTYLLWLAFGPPPGMPISEETTGFLGPFDDDYGVVDTYTAVRIANGWPAKRTPHEWHDLLDPKSGSSLKYISPYDVAGLAPTSEDQRRRFYMRRARPFDEDDDPEFAKLITRNESWYQAILHFEPPAESNVWTYVDSSQLCQPFRFRAMMAFGRGDVERGVESLRFIARLAENRRQWMIDSGGFFSATRCDRECWEAIPEILFALGEPPEALCDFAFAFSEPVPLSQVAAQMIDEGERYHELVYLSIPMCYRAEVEKSGSGSRQEWFSSNDVRLNVFMHRVDWRRFARVFHEFTDGFVERIRITDDKERTDAIAQYRDDYLQRFGSDLPDLTQWKDVLTSDVTRVAESKIAERFQWIERQINYDRRKRRQVRLAVYLARFRSAHGRFPNSLRELAATIPSEHQSVLRTTLSGEEWHYEVLGDGEGFELKEEADQRWVQMRWTGEEQE